MLVEKCKPLGKTVLIEILKLKNARMKVIIVVSASARAACIVLVVQDQLPCLDRIQMETINPCRSPIIMCYFLNTLPPPASGEPAPDWDGFYFNLSSIFKFNETLKPVQLIPRPVKVGLKS